MAHGQHDEVIHIRYAEQSRAHLEAQGIDVRWRGYPMGHNVDKDEVTHIAQWLKSHLSI